MKRVRSVGTTIAEQCENARDGRDSKEGNQTLPPLAADQDFPSGQHQREEDGDFLRAQRKPKEYQRPYPTLLQVI